MKAFFDTNVLLDVFLERAPFATSSAGAWALVEAGKVEGLVSVISFTNIFYIARRLQSGEQAMEALRILRSLFTPVACDAAILDRAIESASKDFEDDVQYFSAIAAGADVLLTRDERGFQKGRVIVLTPESFLAAQNVE